MLGAPALSSCDEDEDEEEDEEEDDDDELDTDTLDARLLFTKDLPAISVALGCAELREDVVPLVAVTPSRSSNHSSVMAAHMFARCCASVDWSCRCIRLGRC